MFPVDPHAITERYRELQKVLHPDRYASKSQQEQRMAVQAASYVNAAYETLRSPLMLAIYILGLQGFDLNSETDTHMSGPFLMEQMQWREALDDLSDRDNPRETLSQLSAEVNRRGEDIFHRLSTQLNHKAWNDACNSVRELQFIETMRSRLELEAAALEKRD